MTSKKELKRHRVLRTNMLRIIKEIENRDAFKRKPYTVSRMLRWILYWITNIKQTSWETKRYTKNDLWDLWDVIKIIERRIERRKK